MRVIYILLSILFLSDLLSSSEIYSLEKSIKQAKKSNYNLDISQQNIQKSFLDIQKAKADKLPSLSFTTDYKKEYQRSTVLNTVRNSLDLSWNLSFYKKHLDLSKKFLSKSIRKNKEIIIATLVYRVKLRYFSLMRLKEELLVLEKNVNLLKKQKKVTKIFVDSQIKLLSTLFQIEDQMQSLRNQILNKKNQIEQQKDELIHLIFVSNYKKIKFKKYNTRFKKFPKLSILLHEINTKSPLVQSLKYKQQAIKKMINKPWIDKLPIISAAIGEQKEWPNSTSKFDFHIGFTIPIWDNLNSKYSRQINTIDYMKKKIEMKKKKKYILDDAAILYKKMKLSKKLYLNYKKSFRHQEKTFSLIINEYKSGLGSIDSLITIQKGMINSAFKMSKTFYQYMVLASKIDFYRGEKK